MKTNSKQVTEAIKKHILDSVYDFEGQPFENFEDCKKHVKNEFERVANYPYNLKRIPNTQERFSDYLNGAPFNFLMYYFDMKEFLNGLGINPEGKEYSDEKSAKLYHYLIFKQVI